MGIPCSGNQDLKGFKRQSGAGCQSFEASGQRSEPAHKTFEVFAGKHLMGRVRHERTLAPLSLCSGWIPTPGPVPGVRDSGCILSTVIDIRQIPNLKQFHFLNNGR